PDTAQELANRYHFDLYNRYPITLTEGRGVYVKDTEGRQYLDALAGIAVNSLGHCHPRVVKAIQDQAARLIHISNLYYNEPQSKLAELLVNVSGLERAFFCNSGAEAVEGSIKLARKYGSLHDKSGPIISMENSFHGRTLGTIAMGRQKYQKGFAPIPEGFGRVPLNDIEALEATVDDNTVAVIIEPVQGEGGIRPAEDSYLQAVRELCDQHGTLLILDEIQCGIARTGKMFAYQHAGIKPDIVASAKALGGGFPIGAVIAREEVASAFEYGDHGTTYGGNPLACAAAFAALSTIVEENLAEQAKKRGLYFKEKFGRVAEGWDAIKEIRGMGLMIGVELNFNGKKVVEQMMKRGVLSNCASDTVMRLVPPLIISEKEIDTIIDVLVESIKEEETHAQA
ncbi:MAG: aspartate aminotransferase family protein, partial [Balneolaceae bacterium]